MSIQDQLQSDLKAAMRAGDRLRVDVIRMAIASLKDVQIARVKTAFDAAPDTQTTIEREALSETEAQETITREVKRRRDAASLYRQGGREDLASREEAEASILESYLPRQLTPDELRPLIVAAIGELGGGGIADMGKVMPALMQRFKGRADGRMISQIAREILSQNKG